MSGQDRDSRTDSQSGQPAEPALVAATSTASSPVAVGSGAAVLSSTISTVDRPEPDRKSAEDGRRSEPSSGGSRSGSKKKTNSTGSTSTTKLDVFQRRIWLFQFIAVLLVVGLCVAQLVTASAFFGESEDIAGRITMDLLKESFDIQHVTVATIVEQRDIFLSFLNGSKYTKEEIELVLRKEADPLNLEFVTLVNNQGLIVASALDERIGVGFDPNSIVSRVIESYSTGNPDDALETIIEIGEISKSEFTNLNSPYHLTCDADGYNVKNSLRNQNKALMIYACGAIVDEKNNLKGAKVTGYMLNGKHRISRTALVSSGTDAFTGIIQKVENGWNFSQFLLSRGLSESFVHAIYQDPEMFNEAYSSSSLVEEELDIESEGEFSVVVEPLPRTEYKKRKSGDIVLGDRAPGLFLAGKGNTKIDLNLAATQIGTIAFLCATILAIFLYTAAATRLFLGPLRMLVAAVEKKDQIRITKTIEKMKQLKMSVCAVIFGILAINGLLAGMLAYNFERVTGTYQDQSSALPLMRINEIFYRQQTLEHVIDSRGFALNPDLISLFQTTGSEYQRYLSSSQASMYEWMEEHRVQIFLVLNSSMQVIASASEMPSSSITFDPNGIVTEALAYGSGIRASVILGNNLYTSLNPQYFTNSSLRATQTGRPAAVQLVVTPIFLTLSSTTPVGAIVIAAELNGNPEDLTERGVAYLGEGCLGFFIIVDGEPVMISSASKLKDSDMKNGESLETADIKNLVKEVARTGVYSRSLELEVLGEKFEVVVDQVYPGSEYDHDGHEHLSRTYDSPVFVVQCSSLARWKYLIKTMIAISNVTFFFNLIVSIVLAYVTFKPIYEFGLRYERKWEAKSMHQGGKLQLSNIVPRIIRKPAATVVIDASSMANTVRD